MDVIPTAASSTFDDALNRKRRLTHGAESIPSKTCLAGFDDSAQAVPADPMITDSVSDSQQIVPESSFRNFFMDESQLQQEIATHPVLRKEKADLAASVTAMLTSWLNECKENALPSVFNGRASVSLSQFVATILDLLEHLRCGKEVLLCCLTYVRRISMIPFPVTWNNIYRLLLASVLVSVKFMDDYGLHNRRYARLIGLEVTDILCLEYNFVRMLEYSLYISQQEFLHVCWSVHSAL